MKMTLTFDLPEEKYESEMAIHGGEWHGVVFDVANELRRLVKYETNTGDDIAKFKDWFWKTLEDYGLDPYRE
jgi:hypothetical protein